MRLRCSIALLLVLAGACSKSRNDANSRATSCAETFAEFAANRKVTGEWPDPVPGLACAELYRHRACGDAWRAALDTETSKQRPAHERAVRVAEGCRGAYCGELPEPRPALCREGALPADSRRDSDGTIVTSNGPLVDAIAELDAAILRYEGASEPAATASAARSVLLLVVGATLAGPAPGAKRSTPVIVKLTPDQTVVDGQAIEGDLVAAMAEIREQAAASTPVLIVADPAVPHGRVVEAIDAAKQAGFNQVALVNERGR